MFGHARQRLIDLQPGGNIGLRFDKTHDPEAIATKLRSYLIGQFRWFRWSVRVREDGILVVNKIGKWNSFRDWDELGHTSSYGLLGEVPKPKPRSCACGCGQIATEGAFVEGHLKNALKMKICPGCGKAFDKPGRQCCSRECAANFRAIRSVLGYSKKKRGTESYAY